MHYSKGLFWDFEKLEGGKSDPRCEFNKNFKLNISTTHQNKKLPLNNFFPEMLGLGDNLFW